MKDLRVNTLLAIGLFVLCMLVFFIYRFDTNFLSEEAPKKIGFIVLGDVEEAGWNGSHYQGIKAACENMGLTLVFRDKVPENSGKCPEAIDELANEGVGMIFLCSYAYASEVHDLVKEYENIRILGCEILVCYCKTKGKNNLNTL